MLDNFLGIKDKVDQAEVFMGAWRHWRHHRSPRKPCLVWSVSVNFKIILKNINKKVSRLIIALEDCKNKGSLFQTSFD